MAHPIQMMPLILAVLQACRKTCSGSSSPPLAKPGTITPGATARYREAATTALRLVQQLLY